MASSDIHLPMLKISNFINEPTEIMLLGDSRVHGLNTKLFSKIKQKKVSNIAFRGTTLNEILSTFRLLTQIKAITEVYIGLNFNLYNALNNKNRIDDVELYRNHIIAYLFSPYALRSTYQTVKTLLFGNDNTHTEPPKNKDIIWTKILSHMSQHYYGTYVYPSEYLSQLKELVSYCKTHQINLTFFSPPTHIDLQAKIKEFKLENEYKQFLNDISKLGRFYNYDTTSELTVNQEDYLDPFHYGPKIRDILTTDLALDTFEYSK